VGVSAAPLLRGDTLEGTVLVFSDLSRVKAYQAEIQQLAFHDALTGLPNRRLLKERLTQTLGQAQRHQRHRGPHGGDEFVVLLPEVANRAAAEQEAQHILNALRAPISLKGQDWQVGVSIGVAMFPESGLDANALQQGADQAMYAAKQSGRNRYHVFTPLTQQANPDGKPD